MRFKRATRNSSGIRCSRWRDGVGNSDNLKETLAILNLIQPHQHFHLVSTHFFLPFYDEILLCTRPSSLSFCDEKYPGCPFYALTPWLLFLFLPSLTNDDIPMPIPRSNIRSSSRDLDLIVVVWEACHMTVVFPTYLRCGDIILGSLVVFNGIIHTSMTMDLVSDP